MVGRSLKILKIELPCDPVIPLLAVYPKEMKSLSQEVSALASMFTEAVFAINKALKHPQASIDG